METKQLAQCTYLLVDDDAFAMEVLGHALNRLGATRIHQASNMEEALDLAGRVRPDFVLLDLYMPDADGWTVLKRLRALLPSTPVVMVTGSVRPADFRQSLESHVDGYCIKPVQVTILQKALLQAAARHHL